MKLWAFAGVVGFYVSLVTHATLMLYLIRHDLKTFWLYLPPIPRAGDGIFVQVEEEWLPLRNQMGEQTGKGFGSHQSHGEDLLYALRGPQDQAWLSRDPVGPGVLPPEPSFSTTLSQDAVADAGTGAPIGVRSGGEELVVPMVAPPARLVRLLPELPPEPIAMGPMDERPAATQPVEAAVVAIAPVQTSAQTSNSASAAQGTTAKGKSAPAAAADPAPESDSESDAFARIGSVQFKSGKLDVRLGRKVKTVKPRFTIKGGLDQISIVNPVTVVMVTIADTGKVSDVRVIRSSGSNELDLPWVLAVYKWWFEPATDAAGKATSDIVQLTLGVIDREY